MRRLASLFLLLCTGCASYTTPGGPAPLASLAGIEDAQRPVGSSALAAPLSVGVVRVQAADYESASAETLSAGSFSVVPVDGLSRETVDAVSRWPLVTDAQPLPVALLPEHIESLDDLRLAAAKSLADVLVVYTLDTRFELGGERIEPMAELSVGEAPEAASGIVSTAFAVLLDVRTGHALAATQASARVDDLAEAWRSTAALDRRRTEAERQALSALLSESGRVWSGLAGHIEVPHRADSPLTAAR